MRILVVGNGWSPDQAGGLNRYVSNLTKAIDELGVDQTVLVLGPAETTPSAGLRVVGATSQPLPVRLQGFRREIKKRVAPADVVVAHFALNVLPLFLRRGPRPPMVVHFHGPWAAESRAMREARPVVALKKRVERFVYRRATKLVTLSTAFRDILVNDYGIVPAKISVVGPGVDARGFRPRSGSSTDGAGTSRRKVLCVRRLVPRMGIDVLLEAWAHAGITGSDLVIVGDGSDGPKLRALARRLGISDRVRFAGHLPDDELQLLYAEAFLSVVPSLELEGFGLVALESLASGTPVVASRTGGLGELLADFAPQLLVTPGDVAELAKVLQDCLDGRAVLPSSARCTGYAEQFSWDAVGTALIELYADAARARTATRA